MLPAAVAIDWALPAELIGDRLKPKTRARIAAGLLRYAYTRPITVEAAGNNFERRPGVRTWPVDAPLTVPTATASKGVACPPLLVPSGGTWNDAPTSIAEPMRTRTTRETEAVVVPPLLVPTVGRDGVNTQPITLPARTQTGRHETALVVPLRNNGVARPAQSHPAPTFAAGGTHHALVMRNNSGGAEMSTPVDEPVRTLTTKGH